MSDDSHSHDEHDHPDEDDSHAAGSHAAPDSHGDHHDEHEDPNLMNVTIKGIDHDILGASDGFNTTGISKSPGMDSEGPYKY